MHNNTGFTHVNICQTLILTAKRHCGHGRAGTQCSTKGFESSVRNAQVCDCVSSINKSRDLTQCIPHKPDDATHRQHSFSSHIQHREYNADQYIPSYATTRGFTHQKLILTFKRYSGDGRAGAQGSTKHPQTSIIGIVCVCVSAINMSRALTQNTPQKPDAATHR